MKYKILLVLLILALVSSLTMSLKPTSEICNPGEGCEIVQNSIYSETFGIKNSHFGVLIFIGLIFLTISQMQHPSQNKKFMIYFSVILGALIAIWFLYLQEFILNAYCKYCLVVDFSLVLALITILPEIKKDFPTVLKKLQHIRQ